MKNLTFFDFFFVLQNFRVKKFCVNNISVKNALILIFQDGIYYILTLNFSKMANDYYDVSGDSVFIIMSISDFDTSAHRPNASTDAAIMRNSLTQLGLIEFDPDFGHSRYISSNAALDHLEKLSRELVKYRMDAVFVSVRIFIENLAPILFFQRPQLRF